VVCQKRIPIKRVAVRRVTTMPRAVIVKPRLADELVADKTYEHDNLSFRDAPVGEVLINKKKRCN